MRKALHCRGHCAGRCSERLHRHGNRGQRRQCHDYRGADALKVGEDMELVLKVEGYEDLALPLKVNAGALKVDPVS